MYSGKIVGPRMEPCRTLALTEHFYERTSCHNATNSHTESPEIINHCELKK